MILKKLGKGRNFCYPEEEAQALTLFIGAYRIVREEELGEKGKHITEENAALCLRILMSIREDYGCDFTGDKELLHELELHMISLFLRRKYGIAVTNPMLGEMKSRDLMGYIYGMKAAALFKSPSVSEDEIGYLAQHFILAVAAAIALFFTKIGFIACGVMDCPPGLPVFVTAGISYGWHGAIVQLVILAVTFFIWTPFVLVSNKQPKTCA